MWNSHAKRNKEVRLVKEFNKYVIQHPYSGILLLALHYYCGANV